jgi:hypothetical protein
MNSHPGLRDKTLAKRGIEDWYLQPASVYECVGTHLADYSEDLTRHVGSRSQVSVNDLSPKWNATSISDVAISR